MSRTGDGKLCANQRGYPWRYTLAEGYCAIRDTPSILPRTIFTIGLHMDDEDNLQAILLNGLPASLRTPRYKYQIVGKSAGLGDP